MKPPATKGNPERDLFRHMYDRTETGKKRRSFFGGIARFVLLFLIGCASGGIGVAAQGYLYFTSNLPNIEKLKKYSPPIVTQVYADKGELVAEFAYQRRFVAPIDQVPERLQKAFVAAEDKNFWVHHGVDKQAVLRAIRDNLLRGEVGGGGGASTITQQVAKNFLLTSEKKFIRKIKEAILSTRIERSLTKDQILYLYLNEINFGSSAYGVQAAAQTYFGKELKDLTIAECAMIAGLGQAPSRNNPKRNLKRALERRAYVLKRMHEVGYISEAEYDEAMQEVPKLVTRHNPYTKVAGDFVEHVRKYVEKKYGPDAVNKEGLQIYTTLDIDLTRLGQQAVDEGLRALDKRQGYRGPIKTLTVQGVKEFLDEHTRTADDPLQFGHITEGVITHIDHEHVYVRLGSIIQGESRKEYMGQIKIDPNPKWWVRSPFVRPELRTRNLAPGELPFQVGDLIEVRITDPNAKRRELYQRKYGKQDPEMKNYKEYTEEMMPYFLLEPEQEPIVQSALMARENRTGYVRVLIGGHASTESKYNRATQARRLAGSSFKPVIYAAALNKGFSAADIILDSPLQLVVPSTGEVWRPKNYRGGYQGAVTFRDCLVNSRNVPTIKILQQIGIEHTKLYARKMGYTSPLVENLTMALGSSAVSLEEQLQAFSVFPNKGYLIPSMYIRKIVDRNGKVLEEHEPAVLLDDPVRSDQPRVQRISHEVGPATVGGDVEIPDRGAPLARRALDEATSFIMTTMLQGVIQEGTATGLKKIVGRTDIAGKTGTTNDTIDAWFVGFSPDYTCGVWVGFDDEVTIGEGETGGRAAAPIWGYFMRDLLKDKPVREFARPQTVEVRKIDPRTGLVTAAADGYQELFKAGTGPTDTGPKLIKGSRYDDTGSDLDQF